MENTKFTKEYAVGQYVKSLGLAIGEMLAQKEAQTYYFNSGDKGVDYRNQLIDHVHSKAMDAIKTIND